MPLNVTDDVESPPMSSEPECVGAQICEPIFGQSILRTQGSHTYTDIMGSCTSNSVSAQMDDLCDQMPVGSPINTHLRTALTNIFDSSNVPSKTSPKTSHSVW